MLGRVSVVMMVVVDMWGWIAAVMMVSGDRHRASTKLVLLLEMVVRCGGTVGGRRESGAGRRVGRDRRKLMGVGGSHPGIIMGWDLSLGR